MRRRWAIAAIALGSACGGASQGDAGASGAPPVDTTAMDDAASADAGATGADAGDDAPTGGGAEAGGAEHGSGDATGAPPGDGLGPADFDDGDLDPPSHGGTITFTDIGAAGWYPSRRDPAIGPCDAYQSGECCLARQDVEGDALTPWDQDLAMTLRGPMQVKQIAVYQPGEGAGDPWSLVSGWDERAPDEPHGIAFVGNGSESGFPGSIGTECLVDVTTATPFPCGAGSEPYCPEGDARHWGWAGTKLIVVLARMPHVDAQSVGTPCSDDNAGNWWDAPWIGLSLGELQRAGAFSSCQCYAKNPDEWWLGDGCGQFNVFEVVNDNNAYRNLDVFSTNFFGYAGYVGEGPCGEQCDVATLAGEVDLIDKANDVEAAMGAVASPGQGPGAAFRRPAAGYRYFVMLLDAPSRHVQLAIVHPQAIPDAIAPLLPDLPGALTPANVGALLDLRLPG